MMRTPCAPGGPPLASDARANFPGGLATPTAPRSACDLHIARPTRVMSRLPPGARGDSAGTVRAATRSDARRSRGRAMPK